MQAVIAVPNPGALLRGEMSRQEAPARSDLAVPVRSSEAAGRAAAEPRTAARPMPPLKVVARAVNVFYADTQALKDVDLDITPALFWSLLRQYA